MSTPPSSHDQLLIYIDSPITFSNAYWKRVVRELESRIGMRTTLLCSRCSGKLDGESASKAERASDWNAVWQSAISTGCRRLAVCFLGASGRSEQTIRQSLAWESASTVSGSPSADSHSVLPNVYLAPGWDAGDWAELLVESTQSLEQALGEGRTSDLLLLVEPPIQADPMNEDRYSSKVVGERARRAEVAEIVWELRRRGLQADFDFKNSEQDTARIRRNQFAGSSIAGTSVEVTWGRTEIAGFGEAATEVVVRSGATDEQEQRVSIISADQLFRVSTLGTMLISKTLLALERQPLQQKAFDCGGEYLERMRGLIPSHYRLNEQVVDPKSMGSARIDSDSFGTVRWGEIWTTFCAFAMAGGPPHRGELLVPELLGKDHLPQRVYDEAMQDPRYQLVRSEIQRGIFEATGLETQASPSYGWLGVQCESEAMAGWMVLAVVAENVMARREGGVLYVPLGREFRVRKEVKNVIAAIAKTFYYWQQYRRDRHFGE